MDRRTFLAAAGLAPLAGVLPFAGSRAFAAGKPLTIMASVPGLNFPFFVHMLKQIEAEAKSLGDINLLSADGQNSTTKQTGDVEAGITKAVDAIIISPIDANAMAPALQEAVSAKIPVVTIDRNKGLHNVLDRQKDKYKFVFEQPANFARDQGLTITESGLAGLAQPPDVIVCANDDMALGALEAAKGRNLKSVKIYGFDALPEALARVKDGSLAATIEQFPGKQSRTAVDIAVALLRDGKKPQNSLVLLTPIAITKDNLSQAERLGEMG